MGFFNELKKDGYLAPIQGEFVFGNIADLLRATLRFWSIGIGPVIAESRKTGALLDPELLEYAFIHSHRILHPYVQYALFHDNIKRYIPKRTKTDADFRAFVHVG